MGMDDLLSNNRFEEAAESLSQEGLGLGVLGLVSARVAWLDAPDLGATFVVVADASVAGAVGKAEAAADRLAREMWAARESFMPSADSLLAPAAAVRATASRSPGGSRKLSVVSTVS